MSYQNDSSTRILPKIIKKYKIILNAIIFGKIFEKILATSTRI